jgi:hypothetical protein
MNRVCNFSFANKHEQNTCEMHPTLKNNFVRIKNKWKIFICLVGLIGTINVHGQTEKFKAIFIYNFTKDIEWRNSNQGTFQIAVYGESPIIDELNIIASKKKVGSDAIVIKKVNNMAEIGDSKILYIPSSRKKAIQEISMALRSKNILIITDDASDFFGINFLEVNQRLTFQISKSNIDAHGLKVTSTLIGLGIAVN